MAILLMLASGLVWGYKYLSNQFEDVSISQLLFHMTTDLGGTNWSDFSICCTIVDIYQEAKMGL